MSKEVSPHFNRVKIALIVLYILLLIGPIYVIVESIYRLSTVNQDVTLKEKFKEDYKSGQKNNIIKFAGVLVFLVFGLIGVIKENKWIVFTTFIVNVVGVIFYIWRVHIPFYWILPGILFAILTGVYIKMIIDKQRYTNSNNNAQA